MYARTFCNRIVSTRSDFADRFDGRRQTLSSSKISRKSLSLARNPKESIRADLEIQGRCSSGSRGCKQKQLEDRDRYRVVVVRRRETDWSLEERDFFDVKKYPNRDLRVDKD